MVNSDTSNKLQRVQQSPVTFQTALCTSTHVLSGDPDACPWRCGDGGGDGGGGGDGRHNDHGGSHGDDGGGDEFFKTVLKKGQVRL